MFKIAENKDSKLCKAYRCLKHRNPKDRFCSKHRHRFNKFNRPVAYAFQTLKSNALRRGKEFTLTLEEFREFCKKTNYIDNKGKTKDSATIDRINPTKGYSLDNIQILTLSENGYKGAYEKAPF